jgi:hypothetical protein
MFSHAEGMPVPFLDERNYRLVREIVDQLKFPKLGILGKVHYDGDKTMKDKLDKIFKGVASVTLSGA